MALQQNGIYIAIEGIDGSGKSSLLKNLALKLKERNLKVHCTKEPGGSELGKKYSNDFTRKTGCCKFQIRISFIRIRSRTAYRRSCKTIFITKLYYTFRSMRRFFRSLSRIWTRFRHSNDSDD